MYRAPSKWMRIAKKRLGGSLNRLSVRQVQAATDGSYSDGGNLILRVQGSSSTWVFRYTSSSGTRREMGFGTCYRNNPQQIGESLAQARAKATAARATLARGEDPIDEREKARGEARTVKAAQKLAAKEQQLTLARAARAYHERVIEPQRTIKHAAQWISSLERHVPAELWHKPIGAIGAPELFDGMAEVQGRIPETA